MAVVQQALGKSDKLKVYRNTSDFCYVGRPMTVPKWVSHDCCPSIGTFLPNGLGPHDEEWCETGRMELMLNSSDHHQVCCIGTKEQVEKEMDKLNVVPIEVPEKGRARMRCESPDGKLIAVSFMGVHKVVADVTHEKESQIQKGGTKVATQAVVQLQDELTRERREKEALAAKLAALEEKQTAEELRLKGKKA